MTKICYVSKRFSSSSLCVIEQAETIIEDYQGQGFMLTLRQLYYQFVSRDLLPNKQSEYKRLGSIINDAKLAGMLPWDMIEDRTRNLEIINSWASPAEVIEASANHFKLDPWDSQDWYVEVWVEKEALMGVIEPICRALRVPYFACRGFVSGSELWAASQRHEKHQDRGQRCKIFHLGDHDPSGIDMTRDNQDRFNLFLPEGVEVERLALNMDQIRRYKPPPNPAKSTDSRFSGYEAIHGDQSWELDALEPRVIAKLIEDNVCKLIKEERWDNVMTAEKAHRAALKKISRHWSKVETYVSAL